MIKAKAVKTRLLSTEENAFSNFPANGFWVLGTQPLNMFAVDGRSARKSGSSPCKIHVSHLQSIAQHRFTNITDSMFNIF